MGTINTLPSELRTSIFNLIIEGPSIPDHVQKPNDLKSDRGRIQITKSNYPTAPEARIEADDFSYSSWSRSEGILWPVDKEYYQSNACRLMNVCRTWYVEVKELLRSRSVTAAARTTDVQEQGNRARWVGVRYCLDLVLTPRCDLHASWRCVPFRTSKVDELYISLTRSRLASWDGLNLESGLRQRCGGSPSFMWILCSLLERFLGLGVRMPRREGRSESEEGKGKKIGPVSSSTDLAEINDQGGSDLQDQICVRCVTIDLGDVHPGEDDDDVTIEKDGDGDEENEENQSFEERVRALAVRPLYHVSYTSDRLEPKTSDEGLASRLEACMDDLLMYTLYTYRSRTVFYERIGKVRICFRGEVVNERDLGDLLRLPTRRAGLMNLRGERHQESTVKYVETNRKTLEKRRLLGLSPPNLDVSEAVRGSSDQV